MVSLTHPVYKVGVEFQRLGSLHKEITSITNPISDHPRPECSL